MPNIFPLEIRKSMATMSDRKTTKVTRLLLLTVPTFQIKKNKTFEAFHENNNELQKKPIQLQLTLLLCLPDIQGYKSPMNGR